MTPKEALKGMCDLSKVDDEDFRMWVGLKGDIENALTELETLKRYPTSDEVCEALSKWIEENAIFSPSEVYYDDKKQSFEVGKYEPSVCYKDDEMIWFNWFRLPPHLITLIGRFYEGMEKGEGE